MTHPCIFFGGMFKFIKYLVCDVDSNVLNDFTQELNNNLFLDLSSEIYDELKTIANSIIMRYGPVTMDAGEVLHDALLKLYKKNNLLFSSRYHYFSLVTQILRDIVIDNLRKKKAIKRGGKLLRTEIDDFDRLEIKVDVSLINIFALEQAFNNLQKRNKEIAQMVSLKFYTSLTNKELEKLFECSENSVNEKIRFARAYIKSQLDNE